MMWAAIYVLGCGAYSWFALPWMLRQMVPGRDAADETAQWAAVGFTLLTALMWPFFGAVLLAVLVGRKAKP